MDREQEQQEIADLEKRVMEAGNDPAPEPEPAPEPDPEPAGEPEPAHEAEPAADPEPIEPAGDDEPAKAPPQEYVPQKALHARTMERNEARESAEKSRAELAELKGQLDTLREWAKQSVNGQQQPAAPQQPVDPAASIEVPDPEKDFLGYVNAQNQIAAVRQEAALKQQAAAHAEEVNALRTQFQEKATVFDQEREQGQQALQQQQAQAQFVSTVQADTMAFAQDKPDYNEVYQGFRRARVQQEMQAGGLDVSQAIQRVDQLEAFEAQDALSRNYSPASIWYAKAKLANIGASNGVSQQAVQQEAPPVQQQAQRPTGKPDPATIAKAMAASDGLAKASQSGSTQTGPASIQALLDLDDSEFGKLEKSGKIDQMLAKL